MAYRHRVQRARGGRMDYTSDSNVAREAEEKGAKRGGRKHHRKTGGKVPGLKSGGRADRFARGGGVKGSNKNPFSSAAQDVDYGRTTHNVGDSPGGSGAGHTGHSGHKAGGHHGHKLHGKHGNKDHPGHHFASGGKVEGFRHGGSANAKDHAHKGKMHFTGGHGHKHGHHKKSGGAAAAYATGGPAPQRKATGGPTTMKAVFASGGLVRGAKGRFAKGGAAKEDG